MNGIVNDQVSGVSCCKTCKKYPSRFAHRQPEDFVKECSKENGDNRRHHQPVLIARELMMHTMNVVLKLNFLFRYCIEVEYKTVDQVFHQRKEDHPCR